MADETKDSRLKTIPLSERLFYLLQNNRCSHLASIYGSVVFFVCVYLMYTTIIWMQEYIIEKEFVEVKHLLKQYSIKCSK